MKTTENWSFFYNPPDDIFHRYTLRDFEMMLTLFKKFLEQSVHFVVVSIIPARLRF